MPSLSLSSFRVQRVVAGGEAAAAVVDERRPLGRADLGRVAAARVEAAAGRRVDRARHLALEHDPLAAHLLRRPRSPGSPTAAPPCTGGSGARKSSSDGPTSTIDAEVHDGDPVGDVVDDAEVVRDEDVRQVELVLQVVEQVDHLRLDRDVERGDRLVGDDQLRVQRERARDADPLPLSARELVRVAVDVIGREPDDLEQLAHPRRASARATGRRGSRNGSSRICPTRLRGFSDAYGSWKIICISRRNGRSSRRDSVVMSSPPKRTVPARRLVQPHEQPAERRLAAAGLADDAERLAAPNRGMRR